jgi:hypothetical protein
MLVIVPDSLSDAIYAKVDEAIAAVPDAAPDREFFYGAILDHFNKHGVIPDFSLVKNST